MPRSSFSLYFLLLLAGCEPAPSATPSFPTVGPKPQTNISLPEARRGFTTKLFRKESSDEPVPPPPADLLRTVQYDSSVGKLAAYLTLAPRDGKRHPAIIWIHGGPCKDRQINNCRLSLRESCVLSRSERRLCSSY